MTNLKLDLRVALRRLARQPLSTAVAILTLALGIGGCVAMFALTDAVLLQPLRFPGADRLVTLWDRGADGGNDNVGWATVVDWRQRSHSFDAVAAMSTWMPTVTGGDAELLEGLRVSDGFFQMLGVRPALGRFFTPSEDVRGNHHVVVLSYGLWQRRFGGKPSALGSSMQLGGIDFTVVGVLPADFEPVFGTPRRPLAEIWTPLAYNASLSWACRDCRHLRVLARVKPEVSLAAARREIDELGIALAKENPKSYGAPGVVTIPLQESLFGPRRPLLLGILGAVGLVLLMATANIAGLRYAAALPRTGELSVRQALGAERLQLVRLLVVESAVIAALGTALGIALARAALRAALAFAPGGLERLQQAAIGGRAVAVAVGLAAVATVLFGTLPALAATRSLSGQGRGVVAGRRRGLTFLVVCDVALGVVLLAGAALFGQSLLRLLAQPPGFRPDGLLTVDLDVAGPRAGSTATATAFYAELATRVRALPGVVAVSAASQLPMSGSIDRYGVHAEGRSNANPELDPAADRYAVLPDYFTTMGIPLLRGRELSPADDAAAEKVVVVSSGLAQRVWPGISPLGQRIKIGGVDGPWWTVAGVVPDVRHEGLEAASAAAVYLPMPQWPDAETSSSLVARTTGDPKALAPAVRRIVRELDRDVAVARVTSMAGLIAEGTAARRFAARLLGVFALLALLLAALGVHGVVAQAVASRRRELGVRRALGSSDLGLVRLLLRHVAGLAGAGALAGAFAALLCGRLVRRELYAVDPSDPTILGAVSLLLVLVALAAALGPAWRVLRIEPTEVMRQE